MSKSEQQKRCSDPEAHDAHMRLNGECPWCGAHDESAIAWDESQPCIAGTIGCALASTPHDKCETF